MDPRNKPLQRILAVAQPAAGAGVTIQSTTAAGWLFRSVRFRLVTDVNAGLRIATLRVSNGNTEYVRTVAASAQNPSEDLVYCGVPGLSRGSVNNGVVSLDFPTDGIWVEQGHTLEIAIVGILAGDQMSAIAAQIWEFPTGPREFFWPFTPTILEESS